MFASIKSDNPDYTECIKSLALAGGDLDEPGPNGDSALDSIMEKGLPGLQAWARDFSRAVREKKLVAMAIESRKGEGGPARERKL